MFCVAPTLSMTGLTCNRGAVVGAELCVGVVRSDRTVTDTILGTEVHAKQQVRSRTHLHVPTHSVHVQRWTASGRRRFGSDFRSTCRVWPTRLSSLVAAAHAGMTSEGGCQGVQ